MRADEVHMIGRVRGTRDRTTYLTRLDTCPLQRNAHPDRTLISECREALAGRIPLVNTVFGRDAGRLHALIDRMSEPEILELNRFSHIDAYSPIGHVLAVLLDRQLFDWPTISIFQATMKQGLAMVHHSLMTVMQALTRALCRP